MGRYLGEFKEKAEKNKHLLSSLGIQALKNPQYKLFMLLLTSVKSKIKSHKCNTENMALKRIKVAFVKITRKVY